MLIIKVISLLGVVILTTALVLSMRHSKISGPSYLDSTTVVMSEVMKVVICITIIFLQTGCDVQQLWCVIRNDFIYRPDEAARLLIPCGLYTLQNNLVLKALSNLDAATYQVTYQLKILTTALFSVLMLGRQLSPMKWISLVVLMAGVALVQMPSEESQSENADEDKNKLVGLLAVIACCFSSGFAGVYFEKILRGSPQSLWIRNLQLAVNGIGVGLLVALASNYQQIRENGFFQGYSSITWVIITLQALSGIVVAIVMKYAGNILKAFANSVSIVLSAFLSPYILGESSTSRFFYLGSSAVIGAIVMYGLDPKLPRLTRLTS